MSSPDSPVVGLLYDVKMSEHRDLSNPNAPEQPARIVQIFERLELEGLAARCVRVPSRQARREELELKHSFEYVEQMLCVEAMEDEEAQKLGNTFNSVFLCQSSSQAALLSAGCVLEAVRQVCSGQVHRALCVVRPPGHHAECGCAMGFSIFGNVALAAAEARERGWADRVLIVDWDVHHGNGTQRMFEDDSSVLYFSMHRHDGGKFYPGGVFGHYTSHGTGDGKGYSVNVPWDVRGGLLRGAKAPGDAEFLASFEHVLLPIANEFKPSLIIVSAGFDSAEGDPLGGCHVSPAGFHELTRRLTELAGGRVVLALEGGYNLESIAVSMSACAGALLGDPWFGTSCGVAKAHPHHMQVLSDVREHLAQFWPLLSAPIEVGDGDEVDPCAVPDAALQGTLFEMQLVLKQYAEEFGGSYQDLCRQHEFRVFGLDQIPAVKPTSVQQRRRALSSSFGAQQKAVGPWVVPIVHVRAPEVMMHVAKSLLDTGADGMWLLSGAIAKGDGAGDPQRVSLRDKPSPQNEIGRAQLQMLQDCFNSLREAFPDAWIGVKVPQLNSAQVFQWVAANCGTADAVWIEDLPLKPAEVEWETAGFGNLAKRLAIRIDHWLSFEDLPNLEATRRAKRQSGFLGLVCGSVAGQRQECLHHSQDECESMGEACTALIRHAASLAACVCDVIVSSGTEGRLPSTVKMKALSDGGPLAVSCSCTMSEFGRDDCRKTLDLLFPEAEYRLDSGSDESEVIAFVSRWKEATLAVP